jgi:hypothetical protein
MGMPTTFSILCLVHLFLVSEASRRAHSREDQRRCRRDVAIFGDDLCALWPQNVINEYHRLLDKIGAKISVGKHYVMKDRGCFCEKFFKISEHIVYRNPSAKGNILFTSHRIRWSSAFPLRGLIKP